MARALVSLLVALFALACDDGNRPPALGLLSNAQLGIGQTLIVPLTAQDPDGDRLTFRVTGLPDSAQVSPRAANEAVLVWSPLITDTQPGGRRYEVEVSVDDARGGRASQTFAVVVYPAFGVPSFDLPAGLTLNLAEEDALELTVEVKDDDSFDLTLELLEAPDGARFQTTDRKAAFFYWRPDDQQRQVAVHRAVFRATDDTNAPVTHELTIVLLNAEPKAGCEGTPPTLTHTVPADQSASTLTLLAHATDAQSQVQSLVLHWTRGDPTGATTAVPMRRAAPSGPEWSADLDLGALAPGGTLIHYYLVATDNDDPTGVDCDLSSRLPRAGWFTTAVYPPGTPSGTCQDDPHEPDTPLANAPRLNAGLYPGRRLCGPDRDLVALAPPAGATLAATVTHPAHGDLALRLLDADGAPITSAASTGEGRLALRHNTDGAPLYLELAADTPVRTSYTLELTWGQTCEDDSAEPDSTLAQARPLPLGQPASRQLCSGDADYFALPTATLAPHEPIRITLAFDQRYGDLDLELLDATGALLARSASERSLEEIIHAAGGAPSFARVYGVAGASNDYLLTVERHAALDCPSDGLGDTASPERAATLFQGVYEGFKTCPGSPDWFAVDLNDAEQLDVLILTEAGQARIEAYRDPAASPIATGEPDSDGFAELSVTARGQPERLYFRVVATNPPPGPGVPTVTYALLQEVTDPPGPCRPDRFEPNGAGAPVPLGEGIYTWLRHCSEADLDVFSLTVPAFTTLMVLTSHLDTGYGDIELRDATGTPIDTGLDLGEGAFLEVLLERPGDYLLYLIPAELDGPLGYDLAIFFD